MGKKKLRDAKEAQQKSLAKFENSQKSILFQWRDVKTPEEVVCFFDEAEYIGDVNKLAKLGTDRPHECKEKVNECPIDKSLVIKDFTIQARGPREDEAFAVEPELLKNIRRGNTIIEVLDGGRVIKNVIGRKGLTKFFDMNIDYVDPAYRYDDSKFTIETQNLKNYQLAGAFKAMLGGHSVEVIKTLKANGENCQVSYNPDVQAWIVASKNVGIVVRSKEDIFQYEASRCRFAQEMAVVWFDKLAEIKEKGHYAEFKKDMANKTLVGEYVGSIEHQHMVKYNRVTIIFYAIVNNYSPDICLPPDQALQLFKKYDLDVVTIESLGLYNNYEDLCNALYKAFRDIAKGKIVEEEEGSVLYLTTRDNSGDSSKDKVVGLCKLKTIEYRIFRKMREKLRNFYRNTGSRIPDGLVSSFRKEMNSIIEGSEMPQPLEFYVDLLRSAFDYIKKYPDQLDALNNEYITFQEGLLKFHAKNKKIDIQDYNIFDSQVLDIQDKITYEKPQQIVQVQNIEIKKHPSKVLYALRIVLFCPPGVISEEGLNEIKANFEYQTSKSVSKELVKSLNPAKKPRLLHVYTLEGDYQMGQLPTDDRTEYILYGFTQDHIQRAVESLTKNPIQEFEGLKGAKLNKFFQDQLEKVVGLKLAFDLYTTNLINLNLPEVGASVEPKLIQQLIHLKNQSKEIQIEEEEVKESFKNKEETKGEALIDQNLQKMLQEEESKADCKSNDNDSFETANETLFGTAENCYDALKKYGQLKKLVMVIIPFGIPGSGKSTFLKTLKKIVDNLGWSINSISSDETRQECMENIIKAQKCSRKEAFDKSGASATKLFNSRLEKLIHGSDKGSEPVHIIFIDKNHPVNALPKTIQLITESIPPQVTLRKLYLVPNISQPLPNFPLSSNLFLQCYYRLMKRDDHETLDNTDPLLTTQILFMFFKMYYYEKFDSNYLIKHDIDKFMSVPLVIEDSKVKIPEDVEKTMMNVMRDIKKGSKPENVESVREFMETANKYEDLYKDIPFDQAELEFSILDELLLATEIKKKAKQQQQVGVETRQMAKQKEEKKEPKNELEWTETKETKKPSKGWKEPPIYIGISCESDKRFNVKLKELFKQFLTMLDTAYPQEEFDVLENIAMDLLKTGGQRNGWTIRPSYHVTALFIGGNQSKLESSIFKNFIVDQKAFIEVRAVIYVPGKIMAAVCFPECEIENKHPHMTLLCGKWKAVNSNLALESTVNKGQVFHELYEKARLGQGQGEIAFAENVKFKNETLPAYFVVLEKPIKFEGTNQYFKS